MNLSIENLLYIVAGIVWLIVSVNKQRKAKLAKQMNPSAEEENASTNNEDYMQAFESLFATPPVEPTPVPVAVETPKIKTPRPSKTTIQQPYIDGVEKNYMFGKNEAQPSFFDTQRLEEQEIPENNPLTEDFDVKKAFIYSEIMRRPYAN